MTYSTYINRIRLKGDFFIDGHFNLPRYTSFRGADGYILHGDRIVCRTHSKVAWDYFTQNDDGDGVERSEFLQNWFKRVDNFTTEQWEPLESDLIFQKYMFYPVEEKWLYTDDFYNAPLADLKHFEHYLN